VKSERDLTVRQRIDLFDANTKWLDELQSRQLEAAKRKGTRITRNNRGWTREELYEDRGYPRRH
jgi:hypothetical protein